MPDTGWRYARYINGPRNGVIHTIGPEIKIGDTIRVPLYNKGTVFAYPGFDPVPEYAEYQLHTITTKIIRDTKWRAVDEHLWGKVEWVWIYQA